MLYLFTCLLEFICIRLWRCLFPKKEATWPLQRGDDVRACFRGKGAGGLFSDEDWPLAKITEVNADGTYDVECDDSALGITGALIGKQLSELRTVGGRPFNVPASNGSSRVAPSPVQPQGATLQVGAFVEANWMGGGTWFPGRVAAVAPNSTYSIHYDDGDKEDGVPSRCIRLRPSPTPLPAQAPAAPAPRPPAPPPPPASSWSSCVDPASGRTYYVNSATGETSWQPPPQAPAAPAPKPSAPLPPPASSWSACVDPASGRTYYVNSATRETSWTSPQ